jgi:hypothetical protein
MKVLSKKIEVVKSNLSIILFIGFVVGLVSIIVYNSIILGVNG